MAGPQPPLISASRRTDVPQYYARWFAERRRQGFAEYRTVFGGPLRRVSLRREDVAGYLFWTKYPGRFLDELRALRDEGVPWAFQYTVNGYGPPLEAHIPRLPRVIEAFLAVRALLPASSAMEWRYDPILLSDTQTRAAHVKRFTEIARALAGATAAVNTSIVEPYVKTVRRVGEVEPSARYRTLDPERHATVARRHPELREATPAAAALVAELSAIAREHGMELRACCNPELALARSQCCGPGLFRGFGPRLAGALDRLPAGPSRESCRCVRTVDIGMDNTCLGGCRYCYVVTSQRSAVANYRDRHSPGRPSLR